MKIALNDMTVFAFCDPAGDKRSKELKKIRARSAVVVIAVDALRRVFVLHAWAKKCAPEVLVEQIEWVQKTFKPKRFGIEANAMQSLFAGLVRAKFKHEGIRAAITPVFQPTKIEKDYRIILAVHPVMSQGRLFMKADQVELLAEIRGFPTHRTKDLIDALASAISLAPARTKRAMETDHKAGLAKYLRATRAPEGYTRRKLRAA